MRWGDRILYRRPLYRDSRWMEGPETQGYGDGFRRLPIRIWLRSQVDWAEGVYLGTRTLANGEVQREEHGNDFYPMAHFTAAVVSPGANRNPVYVMPSDVKLCHQEST